MTIKEIIEGMTILLKYYKKQDGYYLAAEHDELFMYPTDISVTDEDVIKLQELGWDSYDGGWKCFV